MLFPPAHRMLFQNLVIWSLALAYGVSPFAQDESGAVTGANEQSPDFPRASFPQDDSGIHLLDFPQVEIDPEKYVASDEEAKEILDLIESLVDIENPNTGTINTPSGMQFAPIPKTRPVQVLVSRLFGLEDSPEVLRLIEFGPKALPFLLRALDDPRPTKRVVYPDGSGRVMWLGFEVKYNFADLRQSQAAAKYPSIHGGIRDEQTGPTTKRHVVTVGDVCFVLIGHIANRPYKAVRYLGNGCIVVNSPTETPDIAAFLRDVWVPGKEPQALFRSLLVDFHIRGNGAHAFQLGAVLRLLHYYPEHSRDLVVERLDGLHVRGALAGADRRNGIDTTKFIRAATLAGREHTAVALANILRRTDSPEFLLAGISDRTVEANEEMVLRRIREFLVASEEAVLRPFPPEHQLLRKAAKYYPSQSRSLFDIYAGHGSVAHVRGAIMALKGPGDDVLWAVDFLSPLLDDQREFGWTYSHTPGKNDFMLPIRICDEAAGVIVEYLEGASFLQAGLHASLDKQITAIKQRIRLRATDGNVPHADVPSPFLAAVAPDMDPSGKWLGFVLEGYHYDNLTVSFAGADANRVVCHFQTHTDVGDREVTAKGKLDRGVLRFDEPTKVMGKPEPWTGLLLFRHEGRDHLVSLENARAVQSAMGIGVWLKENGWAYSREDD